MTEIPQKFLDQVDVGHDHTATAVTVEAELVQRVTKQVSFSVAQAVK